MTKLFYVLNARIPSERAHAVQVMKTCEAIARRGVDITVVVPWRFGVLKEDPFVYYGLRERFPIVRLPSIDFSAFGWWGFWVSTMTFMVSMIVYLLGKGPVVVYSRDEMPVLVARALGKRIFWEAHDGRLSILTRMLLPRLSGLVVITNGLKDFYRDAGYCGAVVVAPDGFDPRDFDEPITRDAARTRLGLPLEGSVVLYAGSLQAWKGCDTFLASAAFLPDARYVVIGGSVAEVQKLQVQFPNVSFLGERPYKELPVNQCAADVLVVPNTARLDISARFTSPLKVFAHMASGVPIVVADLPSMREVLSEGNAFFFMPDDVSSLTNVVRYVLDHTDDAERRARQACESVKDYSWDNRAGRLCSFIDMS